ncbi:glycosyltransferase family 9 protein [Mucilaginibacter flavus]|uniref:glycosyltransferase family 9 protein n=1 Tax=Mucilaginibacter flavus TaxID=931504 RepID=UPI0025B30F1D|nr:glycosyltransferase family 9 protein [Mucilaginibacter flavus]MDN3584410.1 glycosyltransferase family 9 protein [Mucilaginibacter flavus]
MSFTDVLWLKFKFVIIRKVLPSIIYLLCSPLPRQKQRILIIKADGIGDYLLFRNFLHFLKGSQKYKHHQFYLTVNQSSARLAKYLDGDIISTFFTYSEGFFLKWELIGLLWKLQRTRFDTVIYPNYSRSFQVDWLVRNLSVKNKIGVDGDCVNETAVLKNEGNRYYSELLDVGTLPLHEFERNKQIVELIASEKCFLTGPIIAKSELDIIDHGDIIIFPGASTEEKKWPVSYFYALCSRIYTTLGAGIVVAPGKGEAFGKTAVDLNIPADLFRVADNLSLEELCTLIGGAALLVSGDTVAVHIAAALNVPVVCICKGDLYGRFVPYPSGVFDKVCCVLPRNVSPQYLDYSSWSPAKIADVDGEDVFDAVSNVWAQKKEKYTK